MRVNSHCGAGRDSGNLCRKFGSRGHAVGIVDRGRRSRLWGTRFWDPGCRGLVSRGLGSGVLCVGVPDSGSRVRDPALGSRPRVLPWGPGSRLGVPGPAFPVCSIVGEAWKGSVFCVIWYFASIDTVTF